MLHFNLNPSFFQFLRYHLLCYKASPVYEYLALAYDSYNGGLNSDIRLISIQNSNQREIILHMLSFNRRDVSEQVR